MIDDETIKEAQERQKVVVENHIHKTSNGLYGEQKGKNLYLAKAINCNKQILYELIECLKKQDIYIEISNDLLAENEAYQMLFDYQMELESAKAECYRKIKDCTDMDKIKTIYPEIPDFPKCGHCG